MWDRIQCYLSVVSCSMTLQQGRAWIHHHSTASHSDSEIPECIAPIFDHKAYWPDIWDHSHYQCILIPAPGLFLELKLPDIQRKIPYPSCSWMEFSATEKLPSQLKTDFMRNIINGTVFNPQEVTSQNIKWYSGDFDTKLKHQRLRYPDF